MEFDFEIGITLEYYRVLKEYRIKARDNRIDKWPTPKYLEFFVSLQD